MCNSKDKIREQLNQDSTHAIWYDIRSPHSNNNSNCSSDESSDSDENAFTINEVQNQPNTRKKQRSFNANLKIGKSTIPFQIDSGSSVNIIDETTFQRSCVENQENGYSGLAVRRPYPWWDSWNSYLNKKANHQCEDRGCERDNGLSLEWSDVHRFKFLNGQSQQRKDEIYFY